MDAEQTQVNLLVVRAFDALRIAYFLGGSMASSVHGIYRATADADFVAAVRPDHVESLARLLQPAFYADAEAMRAAAASGRSFNVIHLDTMLKVDVFVARTDPFHLMQMRRRVLQATGPDGQTTFYVASPEDTILPSCNGIVAAAAYPTANGTTCWASSKSKAQRSIAATSKNGRGNWASRTCCVGRWTKRVCRRDLPTDKCNPRDPLSLSRIFL